MIVNVFKAHLSILLYSEIAIKEHVKVYNEKKWNYIYLTSWHNIWQVDMIIWKDDLSEHNVDLSEKYVDLSDNDATCQILFWQVDGSSIQNHIFRYYLWVNFSYKST